MNFYSEIAIQASSGEWYLFPVVIERDSLDDTVASLQPMVNHLRSISKAVNVPCEPIPVNGAFVARIEFRVRERLGQVRAGKLKIREFELVDAVDYDGESLTFKRDQDGRYLLALKERSYPLFRLLANPQSKPEGEAFVIALPLGEEIGPMSPVFEAFPELEAEHQLRRAREADDT